MEDSCEHGNEPSDSIMCWGNSSLDERPAVSQEGFSSIELVCKYEQFTLRTCMYIRSSTYVIKPAAFRVRKWARRRISFSFTSDLFSFP
jgi:hypothetical protein